MPSTRYQSLNMMKHSFLLLYGETTSEDSRRNVKTFFLTSHVIRLHLRRHNVVKTVCAYWIERTQKSA